ncbi:MAG: SRPBCC family protein [Rhodobiaceae bacterium]|nr:SRPBCC family protein [Rhodobiaceae bacterium]
MLTTNVDEVFEHSADEIWDLIGDFGDMGRWSGRPPEACVQDGEGIGCLRTITLDDGQKIVDRLEAETALSYSYSIVSAPLPFESYRATMAVEPIDSTSCRFTWSGEFEPKGIADDKAIQFTQAMYHMGIGLMKDTLAKKAP